MTPISTDRRLTSGLRITTYRTTSGGRVAYWGRYRIMDRTALDDMDRVTTPAAGQLGGAERVALGASPYVIEFCTMLRAAASRRATTPTRTATMLSWPTGRPGNLASRDPRSVGGRYLAGDGDARAWSVAECRATGRCQSGLAR